MRNSKFVLDTEILGSCKKQIRQFILIKIKELMRHSISRETTRIINLAKSFIHCLWLYLASRSTIQVIYPYQPAV